MIPRRNMSQHHTSRTFVDVLSTGALTLRETRSNFKLQQQRKTYDRCNINPSRSKETSKQKQGNKHRFLTRVKVSSRSSSNTSGYWCLEVVQLRKVEEKKLKTVERGRRNVDSSDSITKRFIANNG